MYSLCCILPGLKVFVNNMLINIKFGKGKIPKHQLCLHSLYSGTPTFWLGLQFFIKEESGTAIFKILVKTLNDKIMFDRYYCINSTKHCENEENIGALYFITSSHFPTR